MRHSVLDWWMHFNHCSPEGRQFRLHPCGDGEELFLVELNNDYILHCRLKKNCAVKNLKWNINFFGGNWSKPDFSYSPDKLDDFFNDLIAGKFDPLKAPTEDTRDIIYH